MTTKQTTLQQDLGSLAADLVTAGNHEGAALVTAAVNAMAAPQQPVAASKPVALTDEFIAAVILNVCEIPDRNSPDDEPEAMVCTPDELTNSIRRAEEEFDELDKPIFTGLASTNQPVHAQALTDEQIGMREVANALKIHAEQCRGSLDPNVLINMIDAAEIILAASQPSAPADVAAVRDAALEEAATTCMEWSAGKTPYQGGVSLRNCADAIRALKSAAPTAHLQATKSTEESK